MQIRTRRSSAPDNGRDALSAALTNGHAYRDADDDDDDFHTRDKSYELEDGDTGDTNGPPRKKRRTVPVRTQSPPWKPVAADGPTSFVEDGRRKSGRTNVLPVELLPPSSKRATRMATSRREPKFKSGYAERFQRKSLNDAKGAYRLSSEANERHTSRKVNGTNGTERRTTSGKTIGGQPTTGRKPGRPPKNPPTLVGRPPGRPAKSYSINGKPIGRPPGRSKNHGINGTNGTNSVRQSGVRSPEIRRQSGRMARDASPPPRRRDNEETGHVRRSSRSIKYTANSPLKQRYNGYDTSELEADEESLVDEGMDGNSVGQFDENYKVPLLKFKVKAPRQTVTHPEHVLQVRKYASFQEWLDNDDPFTEGGGSRMSIEDARKEARIRIRLLRAGQPGGILSEGRCSLYAPETQDEPPTQYPHWDHVVAHALRFKTLMGSERRHHIFTAKRIAHAVQARWKELQPKLPEEIESEKREEHRQIYRQMVKREFVDVWKTISDEVDQRRLARWEVEKELMTKEALNAMLEQSKELHARRIQQGSIDGSEGDLTGSELESLEEDEDNMSSSESGDEEFEMNYDEDLTVEQLRVKYGSASDGASRSVSAYPEGHSGIQELYDTDPEEEVLPNGEDMDVVALDNVDEALLDDSDDSTDMSGDMGSSDESSSDEDSMDEDEDESDDGLLGFFGKFDQVREETDEISVKQDEDVDMDEVSLVPVDDDAAVAEPNVEIETVEQQVNGRTPLGPVINRVMPTDPSFESDSAIKSFENDTTSFTDENRSQLASSATTPPAHEIKTPVPFLLRGILREYQHEGLDWLASQFAHKQNGILADEMGLGKTIQSIALLAHLACEHQIWGPHLIVVPTSVMLNWEMEFKKWAPGFKILTYYGTQEERKQKRKGWLNDDLWNVCITSYQLVLQDQQTFKRRNWQYLILDEAHNIKNFRSQRWQTLLNFKTRARLLLTGTPLQNNLSELWSLLYFLMPSEDQEGGISQFAGLRDFLHIFRKPVEEILENGRDALGPEAQGVVHNLHSVLRPFLLRRLKADVEKQMPLKYEHVVYCRLSKRQRFLYDGFMARSSTRDALKSGNYLSVMGCLIQLRKVCNHPDLFETRPIVTSFTMDKSAISDYEIKELLVRRRLLQEDDTQKVSLDFLNLLPTAYEHVSAADAKHSHFLNAIRPLRDLFMLQDSRSSSNQAFDGSDLDHTYSSIENNARQYIYQELTHFVYQNALKIQKRPIYGRGTIEQFTLDPPVSIVPDRPINQRRRLEWMSDSSSLVRNMVQSLHQRSTSMKRLIETFACITPAVVANDMTNLALAPSEQSAIREIQRTYYKDNFHVPRMCLSIAFPDKRLLQYDCGKLQRLDKLLRELQAGGHRALIFTQMTKVLDILEQFLNIHGHKYLRLDGATKVEQRQVLTDRFNNDPRILCFILSSRSGGLGINLTGADSVIFYDLDWNPAMDKQCQDRAHRIGQTRDVHIYRFVSEYTIESNILRKANQKQLLDDVIIQDGSFTTDYFNRLSIRDMLGDEAVAALDEDDPAGASMMDRTLAEEGPLSTTADVEKALAQVEDKEDTFAAKVAEREAVVTDAADFDDRPSQAVSSAPRDPALRRRKVYASVDGDGQAHGEDLDDYDYQDRGESVGIYMLRFLEWTLQDIPLAPPNEKLKSKPKALSKKRHAPDGPGTLASI